MRAYALTTPDAPASVVDVPEPISGPDGVTIAVKAASINGIDVYQANGYLLGMLEHVMPTVVGRDFAGVVTAVGERRSDVTVGQSVFGFVPAMPPLSAGTHGEVVAGAGMVVVPTPAGVSHAAAASIPLAGATALDAIDGARVKAGDVVLIVGATGGVGSFAVQLAAQRGATVIATAKAGDDAAYVCALGAAETVDHIAGDVAAAVRARHPEGVDVVIELVDRGEAFDAITGLLGAGGRVATTQGAADVDGLAAKGIAATNVMGMPTVEKLTALAAQVAAGTLKVEIQQSFPLADAPAAIAAFMGGTRGKLVIAI